MRCFTVTEGGVEQGISVTATPYPHIGVGELGRGRRYYRFPVAQNFAKTLGKNMIVERASVIKTLKKGTLLLIEEKNSLDKRVIVLVNISAGFRGSTVWTHAIPEDIPCPNRGLYMSTSDGKCDKCGVTISEDNIHPEDGYITDFKKGCPEGITILAEGYCAQGSAGRMGGHTVKLIVMEPKSIFRVERQGRLYGAPSSVIVYWDGEDMFVGTYDEIFPPSNDEDEGELL